VDQGKSNRLDDYQIFRLSDCQIGSGKIGKRAVVGNEEVGKGFYDNVRFFRYFCEDDSHMPAAAL
jgi:hypothetical protein